MKYLKSIVFLFILFFFTFNSISLASQLGKQYSISGKTMGTYYTIKFISNKKLSPSTWKKKVDVRLKEVNKKLSMYNPKSELSLFNQHDIGKPVSISSDFFTIILSAKKLYHLTEGSWDGTIKPLVDLWGFGTKKQTNRIPEPHQITLALSTLGFNHIKIKRPNTIFKSKAITLDLGSIAKGYGVDAIADIFISSDINNILVEIGGELKAFGKNKKGKIWSVGISKPDKLFSNQELYKIIRLDNSAIATSGNYRNFFEINGKTYSHIIDPKTGFPVDNHIVSVSVISKDCSFADGLATALMVMDVKKGLSLVNSLEQTECMIIQKKEHQFISHASENFEDLVIE
ncbi:MAG: FAD:protein FMN transferase [Desulfobacteraceae bacterium]|nr:FAD:protein FMN transferase [Desulfobacteraceae bacterium]